MNMRIVSNCPLCEEQSLQIIGDGGNTQTQQCINCGYATSDRFTGNKENNKLYKTLPEEMQSWSKEANDKVWIPSMITLPFGTLYPTNVEEVVGDGIRNVMKWAFAEMVDIPEKEQENYPREDGNGFHTKKYDTDNQQIYNIFLDAMAEMNKRARQNSTPESKIKLPKLTRLDG